MYLKYDSLVMIKTSLAKENTQKAIKLIEACLKDMQGGKFTLEEIEDAKKSLLFGTKVSLDSIYSITDNYVFHIYDDISFLEDRFKDFKTVSKDEIIALAKKLKINTIYTLCEGDN